MGGVNKLLLAIPMRGSNKQFFSRKSKIEIQCGLRTNLNQNVQPTTNTNHNSRGFRTKKPQPEIIFSHVPRPAPSTQREWETQDTNWSSCCCRFNLLKLSCKSSYRLIVLQLSKWETPGFHWTWHTCQDLLKVVTTLTAIGLMFWNTRRSQCKIWNIELFYDVYI